MQIIINYITIFSYNIMTENPINYKNFIYYKNF